MFVFLIYLIFTMTFMRAQNPDQENLYDSGGWIPKTDLSKNIKKISSNTEKPFVPINVYYSNKNDRSFTDFESNQEGDEVVIAPRSLHSRLEIDGGGIFGAKDRLIRRNPFEIQSTNIPLIETFREKFQEQKIRATKTDSVESEKDKIRLVIGANKADDLPKEKHLEKDAIVVGYIDEKAVMLKQNSSWAPPSRNSEATSRSDDLISLSGTSDKHQNNSRGTSSKNMTSDKTKSIINSTNFVNKTSLIENLTKVEPKQLQPILSKEKFVVPKQKNNMPFKNDTSLVSRFRKQVLNWQNQGPPRFSGVSASHQIPPTLSYSTLPLRGPEPYQQKVTDYYSQRPVKLAQPFPAQSFKPETPEYLPDRDFGLFDRQDQGGQIYPQGYPAQPPPNNSSYYNTPVVNYYYPSVSYQPTRVPQVELTTQAYPPLSAPSQTYQVPGYQYGPPDQSYGPPELPELQPILEPKPYRPQGYFQIILGDEKCVMSRQVGAEALIDVSLSFRSQRGQLKNCALMFSSTLNIALSSMVQSDGNITTVDLVRQLNLRLFSILSTGHISEIKFPWYVDNNSPGLTFADTGTIIITFQPSTSLSFRLLIFSYRDTIPHIPGIVTSILIGNATATFEETTPAETSELTTKKQDEMLSTTEKLNEISSTTEKLNETSSTTEKLNEISSTTEKQDEMLSSTLEPVFLEIL